MDWGTCLNDRAKVIEKASTRCCAITTMPRLMSDKKKLKVWHCWVVLELAGGIKIVAEQEGAAGEDPKSPQCENPDGGAKQIFAGYTCRTDQINSAMCQAALAKRGAEFVTPQGENPERVAAEQWTIERFEQWVLDYSRQRPCYDRMSTNCQMYSSSLYDAITGSHTTVRQNFATKMSSYDCTDPDLVEDCQVVQLQSKLIQVEDAQEPFAMPGAEAEDSQVVAGSTKIDEIDPDLAIRSWLHREPQAAAQEVVDIRADGRIEVVPTAERPHGWGRHRRLGHDWALHATMDGTASP